MNLRLLRAAYRQLKEHERRERDYRALVGQELNYQIIRDLLNSAQNDVIINLTLKDGTRLEMRREDAFTRLQAEQQARRFDPEGRY